MQVNWKFILIGRFIYDVLIWFYTDILYDFGIYLGTPDISFTMDYLSLRIVTLLCVSVFSFIVTIHADPCKWSWSSTKIACISMFACNQSHTNVSIDKLLPFLPSFPL